MVDDLEYRVADVLVKASLSYFDKLDELKGKMNALSKYMNGIFNKDSKNKRRFEKIYVRYRTDVLYNYNGDSYSFIVAFDHGTVNLGVLLTDNRGFEYAYEVDELDKLPPKVVVTLLNSWDLILNYLTGGNYKGEI